MSLSYPEIKGIEMIKRLKVHGFLTLMDTEISFSAITILLGKNGSGKSSILEALSVLGNFARGGINRAFGPPPFALSWQKSKGMGDVSSTRFEVEIQPPHDPCVYRYSLDLRDHKDEEEVREERITRTSDNTQVATRDVRNPPPEGTILKSPRDQNNDKELTAIAQVLRSVRIYDLDPNRIEQPCDPAMHHIERDGRGVASFLSYLMDEKPETFNELFNVLKEIRPTTQTLKVWGRAGRVYWGIEDTDSAGWAHPAPLLSWGDRLLVGLLCVLFSVENDSVIAIEEIDRGFHPSRYYSIIDLLASAAYKGINGKTAQIIATTHSPALVNSLRDHINEIRMVIRAEKGGTYVYNMKERLESALGSSDVEEPIGDIWMMGLLDATPTR